MEPNEKINEIPILRQTKNKFIPSSEFLEFFGNYYVSNIINVYEIVEEKIFFNILPLVSQIYKIRFGLPDKELKELNQFKNHVLKEYNQEYFLEVHRVIRRYILRMLTSDSLTPENNISEYLGCEGLWRSKFIIQIDEILEKFPNNFILSNSVHLEEIYRSLL